MPLELQTQGTAPNLVPEQLSPGKSCREAGQGEERQTRRWPLGPREQKVWGALEKGSASAGPENPARQLQAHVRRLPGLLHGPHGRVP